MARYCVIPGCGRRLRTGNKYCHVHRSEGRYGRKNRGINEDKLAGLVIIFIIGVAFLFAALKGLIEILEALWAFLYSNWIIIFISSLIIVGFEFWRSRKKGLNGMYKFEKIIFIISLFTLVMIIFLIMVT